MIRVIGGRHKGRRLQGPPGLAFRPTTGRVKEYIFNIIGTSILDARVLDIFAGTGSLGIEALSRGAEEVVFIEQSRMNLAILEKNISLCSLGSQSRIIRGNVFDELKRFGRSGEKFDFILADPPFRESLHSEIARTVHETGVLSCDGWLIIEHESRDAGIEIPLRSVKNRKFGHCVVTTYAPGG